NNGKPSGLSTNFYLQFADSKGNIVSNSQFPVLGAVAKGSITVPESISQGNYYVRAWTPVMLNSSEDMIYKKNIFVFRPVGNPASTTATSKNVSINFFPESGHLVDGL